MDVLVICLTVLFLAIAESQNIPTGELTIRTTVGSKVILPCEINNRGTHRVSWVDSSNLALSFDDMRIVDDNRFSVSRPRPDEFNLVINDVKASDAGTYTCLVSTREPLRNSIHLVVTEPPRFVTGEQSIETTVGKTVTLPCEIENLGTRTVIWRESSENVLLSIGRYVFINDHRFSVLNRKPSEYNLMFRRARISDEGTYSCVVSGSDELKNDIHLIVNEPPNIVNSDALENVEVQKGSSIQLTCEVTGNPMPNVTWYKIEPDTRSTIKLVSGKKQVLTFEIHNATEEDTGLYSCVADNGIPPSAGKTFVITVQFPPQVIAHNTRIGQQKGGNTVLECQVTASPQPINIIRKDGEMAGIPHHRELAIYQETNNQLVLSLSITDIREDDYGVYTCESTNIYGTMTQSITLYEIEPRIAPNILEEGSMVDEMFVMDGRVLYLICNAEGNPIPTVSWHRQTHEQTSQWANLHDSESTQVIETIQEDDAVTSILAMNKVTRDDAGVYKCVADNEVPPSASRTMTLHVDTLEPEAGNAETPTNGILTAIEELQVHHTSAMTSLSTLNQMLMVYSDSAVEISEKIETELDTLKKQFNSDVAKLIENVDALHIELKNCDIQ